MDRGRRHSGCSLRAAWYPTTSSLCAPVLRHALPALPTAGRLMGFLPNDAEVKAYGSQ